VPRSGAHCEADPDARSEGDAEAGENMMDPSVRIVTQIPLTELWDSTGVIRAARGPYLTVDDVRDLLGRGSPRFAIADIGKALEWIRGNEAFQRWKTKVRTHLVDPHQPFVSDEFPNGLAYVASEWTLDDGSTVIVFEVYH
jgi:hypothetical protein